jgi:electron transport complex protein RnfG
MEIIGHNETPGLGSRIENFEFRKQWRGLNLKEPAELRSRGGSIDAVSGATYSSSAVINGTNQVIRLLNAHRDEILTAISEKENRGP